MRNILITGGAGFIGSNFIPFFLEHHKDTVVVNLDKLTYAGNPDNLSGVKGNQRYVFVEGDIADRELTAELFEEHRFMGVVNFAAESHVDNSIKKPDDFINTNVVGTLALLEAAKNLWVKEPLRMREDFESARFHHISTDEVYGTLGEAGFFTEETPYAPNSPYSASKAGSDFLVRSFHHTYGLNTVITNCSNNFGPRQHDEKLIPTVIRKALYEEHIPIYGRGRNVRDWLYVLDHCMAVSLVFEKGRPGETYNIGARNEWVNTDIAGKICSILDSKYPRKNGSSYKELITFVQDRPGHDLRYAIDPAKIENELGWSPVHDFSDALEMTVDWYAEKYMGKIHDRK